MQVLFGSKLNVQLAGRRIQPLLHARFQRSKQFGRFRQGFALRGQQLAVNLLAAVFLYGNGDSSDMRRAIARLNEIAVSVWTAAQRNMLMAGEQ